jgi:hypothetical protein
MFIEQSSYFRSLSHNHNDVSSEDHYAYLQSSMQSVPITTDVVNSNLDQGEVYNIMW